MAKAARLGVNLDHIATLRQLRGTPYPDLLSAAKIAERAGAQQITVHLREDRRHIQDEDVKVLRHGLNSLLNLEMAATDGMLKFALKIQPDWVCLVPEKRDEVTTEGGLDVKKQTNRISKIIQKLQQKGIKVSLFVEPSLSVMHYCAELGADAVELHTGKYCIETQKEKPSSLRVKSEFKRIETAGRLALELGLHVHAGHGFDYENVRPVANLERGTGDSPRDSLIEEFNIGHAIVCQAAIVGLDQAIRQMISSIEAP